MTQPTSSAASTVGVVGAGIAGIAAARELQQAGARVRVFDRGNRVAGRMSTRRTDAGLAFDHGAQYFTVRDACFERQVEAWIADGAVAEWRGRIGVLSRGGFAESGKPQRRCVGVPGMDELCRRLAVGLDVCSRVTVAEASATTRGWRIADDRGADLGEFESLVLAVPAPQAAPLLRDSPALERLATATRMSGCWAAMLAFDEPLGLAFDGAFVNESPLSWVARNSSKPGRPPEPEAWVLHASPEWSGDRFDDGPEAIRAALTDAFWEATGARRRPAAFATAHRWRFALPPEPLAEPCLFEPATRLGACGDWCGGPRVEGAYLSGVAVAQRLLGRAVP